MNNHIFDQITVVMVETTLPANIGAAARAMMTMGLSSLCLVNPKHPIDDTSYAYAKGGSAILDKVIICTTLQEALGDHSLVIAASSRNRELPRPMLSPVQMAKLIADFYANTLPNHSNNRIALVFGREDRGLTNSELALADFHVQINANAAYPVLNIASSVQVLAAFLYEYLTTQNPPQKTPKTLTITHRTNWDEAPITQSQKQALNQAFIQLLHQNKLANLDDLGLLPSRLYRLSSRLQLDQKEFALMMALLHKLSKD